MFTGLFARICKWADLFYNTGLLEAMVSLLHFSVDKIICGVCISLGHGGVITEFAEQVGHHEVRTSVLKPQDSHDIGSPEGEFWDFFSVCVQILV